MKKYTKEQKIEIIDEYKRCGNVQIVLQRYPASRSSLYAWLKLHNVKTGGVLYPEFTYQDFLELKNQLAQKTRELEIMERTRCFKDSPRQQKLDAVERLYGEYPIREMCRAVNLDRGTFLNHHYRRVQITQYEQRDTFLKAEIKKIFDQSDSRFGVTKVHNKLLAEGLKVSRKKVSALFKELGLKSRHCRKNIFIQQQGSLAYLENKLNRDFNQITPNKFWVSDTTKIMVNKTFFNLCVIIDLYSRKVVAHNISLLNNNALTVNTFKDAFESRNRPQGLSFHSDQGANYIGEEFRSLLCSLKVEQSFSRKANPYDNAVIESFFSCMKREELNSHNFKFLDELELAVERYIEFYNSFRPHNSLQNRTPNQIEKEFYTNLSDKSG